LRYSSFTFKELKFLENFPVHLFWAHYLFIYLLHNLCVQESKSILSPLIPQTKTDEEHVPSPNDSLPMNVYHNVMAQFQSCPSRSLQVLPYDSSSRSSHQQFPRYLPFQMTRINPQGIPPAMMPQYNKGHLWPHPPTLTDFPKFVHAWEVN